MNNSPFLQHIIETMREKHYAKRTIEAYIYWMKFYINFHNKQHPAQLNDSDVEAFLNFLVNKSDLTNDLTNDLTKTSKIAQLFKPANFTIFEW
jgi:hypothetical protein